MQTLDLIRPGAEAEVYTIDIPGVLRTRLEDFGFVPGTRIRCRYRSPGGQVTALECRGAVIALRTRDLKNIRVRP